MKIIIGKYTLYGTKDDKNKPSVWIEHESGEGQMMPYKKMYALLENALDELWKEF